MFILTSKPSVAALVAVAALSMTAPTAEATHGGGRGARPSSASGGHKSPAANGYGRLPKNGPASTGKNSAGSAYGGTSPGGHGRPSVSKAP